MIYLLLVRGIVPYDKRGECCAFARFSRGIGSSTLGIKKKSLGGIVQFHITLSDQIFL